jgi:hypothetical protein
MVELYIVPSWFNGYDMWIEFAFALVTLLVSIYAFRVYKLSKQNQSKLFGIGFALISASYFIQSLLNWVIDEGLEHEISITLKTGSIFFLNDLGIYSHIILFGLGLITLTYMTFKVKSAKIYSFMVIILGLSFLFSSNPLFAFYILSCILLVYVCLHYFMNYIKHRQNGALMIFISFVLLLFGGIHFIFSITHSIYYVLAHLLGLAAYMIILINLFLIVKKGK